MNLILAILVTFFSAAAVEGLSLLWVHYAERNNRLAVFLIGSAVGIFALLGLGNALYSLPCAVAFVLGYGVGPVVAIEIKKRL